MPCTFDKEGNLLRFETEQIWFSATHYHEQKGAGSRDFPMGKLSDSIAEYEHRTGQRGTLAKIEEARAKWMESPERLALLEEGLKQVDETGAPDPDVPANTGTGPNDEPTVLEPVSAEPTAVEAKAAKPKPPKKPTSKAKKA